MSDMVKLSEVLAEELLYHVTSAANYKRIKNKSYMFDSRLIICLMSLAFISSRPGLMQGMH